MFKTRRSYISPVSKIYILNFLCESENGIVLRLKDDMVALVNYESTGNDVYTDFIHEFNINDIKDFNHTIKNIIESVNNGAMPLIHIQGHGDEHKGIECSSGEFLGWNDLITSFKKIIKSSRGELTVVAATCYSFKLMELVAYPGIMPYSFYYGYEKVVTLGDMEDDLRRLYKNFIANKGDVSNLSLNIKLHSEYDNLEPVTIALAILTDPKKIREHGFSNRAFLKNTDKLNIPASKQRILIKKIINSETLVLSLIYKSFHPTQRRINLIEDVLSYLSMSKASSLKK
ncbi:hypothetical protein [Shewanella algae]|uniref:hypothetical protein n=1 Tax=Shewanella algae TaxID=38313 RepID=UPI001AAD8CE8|nr:hypothetical protein [Shewanella algae]QTE83613.1 hypothetical protein JKK46_06890 [Shewanella algae]